MPDRGGNNSQSAEGQDSFESADVQDEWVKLISGFQNVLTLGVAQPQEERRVATLESSLDDPRLDPSTAFECEWWERSVTPIEDSPMVVGMQTSRFVAGNDDEAFPPALRLEILPVLLHQTRGTSGHLPNYWTFSEPWNVIYGLKVWEIDGVVYYMKKKKWFQNRSQAGVESHGSLYNGCMYDTRVYKAGSEPLDYPLLWFLIDRDEENLWEVLMGNTGPAPGCRFLEFPTQY